MDNIVEEFEVPEEFQPIMLEFCEELSVHLKLNGMVATLDLLDNFIKDLT
jgi:hypothetical protein